MVGPQVKRQAVDALREERGFGITRACGLIGISRSLYGYRSRRPSCTELRQRIGELAGEKRRYGYRRIHILLRREGWKVNRKRTYRLYREAGLAVRRRKRKRIGLFERKPLPKPSTVNRSWSMDFIADGLIDGRKLRVLAIVDDYSRECLALEVQRQTHERTNHLDGCFRESRRHRVCVRSQSARAQSGEAEMASRPRWGAI